MRERELDALLVWTHRQHPLPDRLHRQQRACADRMPASTRAAIASTPTFATPPSRPPKSRTCSRGRSCRGELLEAAVENLAPEGTRGTPGLRRREPHRRPARAPARAVARRRGSSSPARARSSACGRSRTSRRSPASAPRQSWPTRRCAASSNEVSPGAPSAMSRSTWSCACAASARRSRASPRSSPSGAHGALPHAEPVRSRSPATCS